MIKNTNHISPKYLIASCIGVWLSLAGCASVSSIEANSATVTNGTSVAFGKITSVKQFAQDELVYFYMNLSWADVDQYQGYRTIEWHWLKEGKIVSKKSSLYRLNSTPFTTRTFLPASALGIGEFSVEAYIDNKLLTKASFSILP